MQVTSFSVRLAHLLQQKNGFLQQRTFPMIPLLSILSQFQYLLRLWHASSLYQSVRLVAICMTGMVELHLAKVVRSMVNSKQNFRNHNQKFKFTFIAPYSYHLGLLSSDPSFPYVSCVPPIHEHSPHQISC
mmetsp:Transcript_11716/g.20388  ORF Transcript_11716/g.20388 Transcript_11716/m.20388 type:complete len:131 (+) Transcript_11716:90-482(+)